MKLKQIFAVLAPLSGAFFASTSHAQITATNSGNWSDVTIWDSGTVPQATDGVDVPFGIEVTVDINASVGWFIMDYGTVAIGTNSSLNVFNDLSIPSTITLDTSAAGNTVIYSCNPFSAYKTNYYNLVLANTNWVNTAAPFVVWQDFNNFTPNPTPMTIAGDWTLMGAIKVQQGSGSAPITIGGNLNIGTGCAWDCSGDTLTVVSNAYVSGLLEDLNGALGSNYIGGSVIVSGPSTHIPSFTGGPFTNGWYVSDVATWGVGGSLTNDGAVFGQGYGSISFDGTGAIAGTNALQIPTMTVNGMYTIADNITVTTNTPSFNGTLIFDLANTNKIIQQYVVSTNQLPSYTNMYLGGNLEVINTGAAPMTGNVYQLFSAHSYAGGFASTSFPSLPAGLSWADNTLTNGSITVIGGGPGSPTLTTSRSGGMLTLSWDSTTYPGFSVQGQTNAAGVHSNWSPTGSGTVSPFMIAINPTNPPVFFRLSNQ